MNVHFVVLPDVCLLACAGVADALRTRTRDAYDRVRAGPDVSASR